MKLIEDFLNQITMYRLMLYYLIVLVVVAILFSGLGILPYNFLALVISTLFLIACCLITNDIFAKTFKVPANVESVYISALILALIITPATSLSELIFLAWAAVWAMAAKYILVIGKKHLFNPAAIAVVITAYGINHSASWWIGNLPMLPFVLVGGFLIVKKIRRWHLVISFLLVSLLTIAILGIINGTDWLTIIPKMFFYSPLIFFGMVMLTEPLTTPATKTWQMVYGSLVGFLFTPQIHFGFFYTTPETALVIGNLFSYLVSPKEKLILKLQEKIPIAPGVYDFVFGLNKKLAFTPGQYMEWTLAHPHPDNRGNRRYFTLASAPSEKNLRIGVKFSKNSSSFKKALLSMDDKSEIVAGQRSGDFVLDKDINKKYVFIAGGIGITPFRSIIKDLLDTHQKRSMVLFYSNREVDEIVYKDIFSKARQELGLKVVYVLTGGKGGRLNGEMIMSEVPDYKERMFYLSGPHGLVTAFKKILQNMGVTNGHIKTDYFSGYA